MAQKKKQPARRRRDTTAKNVRHMQNILAGIFMAIGVVMVVVIIALVISYM